MKMIYIVIPVSMLSLTIQVPQSRAMSHGTSNPYFGITIISPGTNSLVEISS